MINFMCLLGSQPCRSLVDQQCLLICWNTWSLGHIAQARHISKAMLQWRDMKIWYYAVMCITKYIVYSPVCLQIPASTTLLVASQLGYISRNGVNHSQVIRVCMVPGALIWPPISTMLSLSRLLCYVKTQWVWFICDHLSISSSLPVGSLPVLPNFTYHNLPIFLFLYIQSACWLFCSTSPSTSWVSSCCGGRGTIPTLTSLTAPTGCPGRATTFTPPSPPLSASSSTQCARCSARQRSSSAQGKIEKRLSLATICIALVVFVSQLVIL